MQQLLSRFVLLLRTRAITPAASYIAQRTAPLTPRPCQAYSASDPKTIDLTAAGCGAVNIEVLSKLLAQFPGVEMLFITPGEQANQSTLNHATHTTLRC